MKIGNLEVVDLLDVINKENIFVGNIIECIKYQIHPKCIINDGITVDTFGNTEIETTPYRENVILIKIIDNPAGYIALDDIKNIFDYKEIYNQITENGYYMGGIIMSNYPSDKGDKYIDEGSLKSYYQDEKGKVKVKQIKKDVLLDPRIKSGIEN